MSDVLLSAEVRVKDGHALALRLERGEVLWGKLGHGWGLGRGHTNSHERRQKVLWSVSCGCSLLLTIASGLKPHLSGFPRLYTAFVLSSRHCQEFSSAEEGHRRFALL